MKDNTHRYTVVGLGEILWDMLPGGKQLGGAPANFAYHTRALGENGSPASCVGSDEMGKEILERLDGLGLDRRYVAVDDDHPTGTVTVRIDANGKPDYTIHENVAWDYIPASEGLMTLAGRCDAVCFGSLCQRSPVSRRTILAFLAATGPECIRTFDINLRQDYFSRKVIDEALRLSTVLKLNDEELPVVARLLGIRGGENEILSALTRSYGLHMIALTRGAGGSLLCAGSRRYRHSGYPAKVADTVGAGDAFAAAVAVGLLRRLDPERINDAANRVAGFVCSRAGATPVLPESLTGLLDG